MFRVAEHLEKLFYRLELQTRGRETGFAHRMDGDFTPRVTDDVTLASDISKMRAVVLSVVGAPLVEKYAVRAEKRKSPRYALWLPPELIEVVDGVCPTPRSVAAASQ